MCFTVMHSLSTKENGIYNDDNIIPYLLNSGSDSGCLHKPTFNRHEKQDSMGKGEVIFLSFPSRLTPSFLPVFLVMPPCRFPIPAVLRVDIMDTSPLFHLIFPLLFAFPTGLKWTITDTHYTFFLRFASIPLFYQVQTKLLL